MRWSCVVAMFACACGRLGFDAVGAGGGGDGGPADGSATQPPELACGETRDAASMTITGFALVTVPTSRGIAALWIDQNADIRATTWIADDTGIVVERDGMALQQGPYTALWAASNRDAILILARLASGTQPITAHAVRDDLTSLGAERPIQLGAIGGRDPLAPSRTGDGFVAAAISNNQVAIHELAPDGTIAVTHPLTALASHAAPSIAADLEGYAVVTELADQYGPGCWLSTVSDSFTVVTGPSSIESTQQADCDSSTVSPTSSAFGVAIAWMDRDPVNSVVEWRGTRGGGGGSPGGETGVATPVIATSSSGSALLYRSTLGLRRLDGDGATTLAAAGGLADLVTWGDRTVAVWSDGNLQSFLTRLCP